MERIHAGSHARFEGAESLQVRGREKGDFARAPEEEDGVVADPMDLHTHAVVLGLGDGGVLLREGDGSIDGVEWRAERAVAELTDTHGVARLGVLRSESGRVGREKVDEGGESWIVVEGFLAGGERALLITAMLLEIELDERLAQHLLPEAKTPISQNEGS